MYIVSSSLMRVVFNSRLFLAAFRYISIILFRVAMIFPEELNLHQGHGALFQAHTLSLHHLHDLPNESVSAGCQKRSVHGLASDRLIFVHVHTFTSDTASDEVP